MIENDRIRTHLVGIVLGATLVCLPLVVQPTGLEPWRFPKVLLLRTAAAAVLALLIFETRWIQGGAFGKLGKVGVFVLGWILASTLLSANVEVSLWAFSNVLAATVLFLAAWWWTEKTESSLLTWLVLVPGAVSVAVLALQVMDVWHPLLSEEERQRMDPRELVPIVRSGLLGNRNDLSMFLLLPFSVLTSRAGVHGRGLLWLLGAGIVLGSIVLTTTISAVAAALVIGAGVLLYRVRRAVTFRRAVVACLLGAVVIGALLTQPPLLKRIQNYRAAIETGDLSAASGHRVGAWLVAVDMIVESPLLGSGPGRYPYEYLDRALLLRGSHPRLVSRDDPNTWDMVHNDYLEIAAESGLPALVGVMTFTFLLFRRFITALDGNSKSRTEVALAASGCLAGLLLCGLLLYPLQLAGVYGALAIHLGASLAVIGEKS